MKQKEAKGWAKLVASLFIIGASAGVSIASTVNGFKRRNAIKNAKNENEVKKIKSKSKKKK